MRIPICRRASPGVLFLLCLLVSPAAAQTSAAPPPPPTTVPDLGNFTLPPQATAPLPTPVITPTPSTVAPPVVVPTVRPTPRATARAVPARAPKPRPTATAEPAPSPTPTPPASAAAPTTPVAPAPSPSVSTIPAVSPVEGASGLPFWAIPAVLVALLLVGGLIVALRRRRAARALDVPDDLPQPGVLPTPVPAPQRVEDGPALRAATPPSAPQFLIPTVPRAWLELSVSPRRAGVNLITATADVDVVVRNSGVVPAENVRVGATLLSARAGQDAELDSLFGAPVDRPIAAPFSLAPGEERHLRTLATLGRDAITVLSAGERPMFVPMIAVNARYVSGQDNTAQTAQAFAIGVRREGAAKLAPFWLDRPGKIHQALDARPHAEAIRR